MNKMRATLAVFAAALLGVALWGCAPIEEPQPIGQPADSPAPFDQHTPESKPPPVLKYGQAFDFHTSTGGVLRVSVEYPTVTTLHDSEFDPDCTVDPDTCSKPGAGEPWLGVLIKAEGVSGMSSIMELTYEYIDSKGAVIAEEFPVMTHEDTDPLSNQPTELGAGQHVDGKVWFHTSDGNGQIRVTPIMGEVSDLPITWGK